MNLKSGYKGGIMKVSTCCDELPMFELQDEEDGICSGCGEHSEFYEEGEDE